MTPLEIESKGYDYFHRGVKWPVDSSNTGVILKERKSTPSLISGNKYQTPSYVVNQLKREDTFTPPWIKYHINTLLPSVD